jgi:hypothetical protein
VKKAFPGAEIIEKCVDVYPVRVIVSAEVSGQTMEIWSGRQQSLFGKNASQRTKTMAEIGQGLADLKEDFNL